MFNQTKQDILPKDLICLYPILILQKKMGQVVLFKNKIIKINQANTKEILLYNKRTKEWKKIYSFERHIHNIGSGPHWMIVDTEKGFFFSEDAKKFICYDEFTKQNSNN